jgi:hypothetical protein
MFINNGSKLSVSQAPGLKDVIRRVSQHEVGHYIAARICGFKTGDLSLELTDHVGAHKGSSVIELYKLLNNDIEKTKEFIENRIIVLYAGVLAENMIHGNIDTDAAIASLKTTGENDFSKIRELLNLFNNIKSSNSTEAQKSLTEIEIELWNQAIDMIKQESQLIEGVAGKFASLIKDTHTEYTLSAEDLEKILRLKTRFSDS